VFYFLTVAPSDVLTAQHVLEFPYSRSVGPVIGSFLAGLRDGRVLGVRAPDGTVIVPPLEYDPYTGQATGDFVEVGTAGVVTTWTWVTEPLPKHPLPRPFAWALIRLEGADTAMLHAVDAGGNAERMSTGMGVRIRWADRRVGHIRDIECFVPVDEDAP